MKTETPRTTALIADIVQNPGLEWTRAEVEQLGEHAFQLERELNAALSSLEYIVKTDKIMRPDICHVQAEKILAKTHGRDA